MKTLELKSEDFPIGIRLISPNGAKEYVLIKTKQGKLVLNKPISVS
jgi:hemin uptake protein HemP